MIRIYNGLKKVDRVYQVELEILYFKLPSLLNNSQNSPQECSGQVQYLTACKVSNRVIVVVSEVHVDCNLEALYLSVLDFEYRA